MELKIGEDVYLFLVDQNEMIRPARFKVGGVFTGKGFPAVVEGLVYVDYADLRAALGLSETYYSSLLVMLEDKFDTNKALGRLQEIAPSNWAVVSPDASGSFFKGIYQMIDITTNISNFLMYVSIFLFVYSILLMNITGRRREIGIMSSLGVSNPQAFLIFVAEGTLLGLIPAVIGALLGLLLVFVFTIIGIPAVNDAMKYMFASDMLYFRVNRTALFNAVIVVPLMAFLGAVFPTYKVLKLRPVEALKNS
jgi:putative ABC transport system permease protein